MNPQTRRQYDAYNAQVAKLNEVSDTSKKFTVAPSVQQKLEDRIQESSEFLRGINMIGVEQLQGEKVGLGVMGTVASRTDTSNGQTRQARNVEALDNAGYQCVQTDFDTAIRYSTLDTWAKFPNFQARLRDAIVKRQALDRLMIGFNGTSVAATTNRANNPMLQDVNKGWLQQYRENAPARVLSSGKTAGKVVVGPDAGADYRNLDALVFDALAELIDPWHQKDPSLIVILGRKLVHDKYFPQVNKEQPSTEKLATDVILSQKTAGGLPLAQVPYIPDGTLMITSLQNLSLYWQLTGRRRYVKEEPERNRIANYESSNDTYVVEDYGLGCVVEKIELVEA